MSLLAKIQGFNPIIKLQKRIAQLQNSVIDVLSGTVVGNNSRYHGTCYRTYDEQVKELSCKYNGNSDWGSFLAKTIVDLRAAFTVSGGVAVSMKDDDTINETEAQRTLDFLKLFMAENNLDEEVPMDWAKEGEIEGKFLCRLYPNPLKKTIEARFIAYTCHKYKIETAPDDYAEYVKATYKVNGTGAEITLNPDDFVYKKFGGRTHLVNETPSKAALLLDKMENLDKALWDWRKINYLFASPTPYIQAKDEEAAKKMWDNIDKKNWKLGKLIVTSGTFSMVEVGLASKESLQQEIQSYIKAISGATNVPPHFLGAPELMSNRSTSTDLFDLIESGVVRERKIWAGGYEELFIKAIRMYNANFQGNLKEDVFKVELPPASKQKLQEVVDIWLPLFNANVIDQETILDKTPDVDKERILQNIEDKMQKEFDQATAMAKAQGRADTLLNGNGNGNGGGRFS